MSDLIDRQAAIDALEANKRSNEKKGQILCADEDEIIKWLNSAPSAETIRHGKWVLLDDEMYATGICSCCGGETGDSVDLEYVEKYYKYCPFCGARMDGKKMKECYNCGFYDSDSEGCACPSYDKWYACPIESENIEKRTRRGFEEDVEELDKWIDAQRRIERKEE